MCPDAGLVADARVEIEAVARANGSATA